MYRTRDLIDLSFSEVEQVDIYQELLQPPLYEMSAWEYQESVLTRKRTPIESWVLIQPKPLEGLL